MKKRLVALILAGLLTASMASCVATGNNTNTGGGENTLEQPSQGTTSGKDDPIVPQPNSWKEVDKTLYTFESAILYSDAKTSSAKVADLPAEFELHCTLQNTYWSYVEYVENEETVKGYVSNESLTNVDLLAKSFTGVDGGEKTMYIAGKKGDTARVRLYPCTDTFSTVITTLSWNEPVTVVSENGEWSRIAYEVEGETKYYFISSNLLTDTEQIDYDDPTQWENLFEECTTPLTKYVNGNTANLRKAPNADATGLEILTLDTEVTVKATAQIGESNWSYVEVWMPEKKPGDGPYLAKGYINSKLLSDKKSSAPATLEDLLDLYEGAFEALETPKTMYATGTTNVRSTPLFPNTDEGEKSNIVAGLTKAEEVKVVASGAYDGYSFYVIEYTIDEKLGYYFVGASTLTTDPTGTPTITLDDLTEKYPQFEICVESTVTVTNASGANCYLKPEFAETPDLHLELGDEVTLVATANDSTTWWVIRAENGTLYFVNSMLFQTAAN
ncbi:MAG: hypothetical protein IJW29_03045 [Clostridia bacterium]|nr:hypothetical protein [Clostridia bacterium]